LAAAGLAMGGAGQVGACAATPNPAIPGAVTVAVDAAAAPGAPLDPELIGINQAVPATATHDIPAEMRAISVEWARTDVSFESTDFCRTGTWDPAAAQALDAKVALDRSYGARPELLIDYTPSCLATGAVPGRGAYAPPDATPATQVAWDGLVRAMASHEIANGVTAFEIWNEPDGTFWTGTLAGYLHLYADTAAVLEQVAAQLGVHIEVGGPALTFPDPPWIEALLAAVQAQGLPLDFLSWHHYADYPALGPQPPAPVPPPGTPPFWYNPGLRAQAFGEGVALVKTELAKFPALHPKLWLDEWNADAGYDARQDGPFDGALVAAVLDNVTAAGLDRMAFFRVADDTEPTLGNWGMLFADGTPKPAYQVFSLWHGLGGGRLPVQLLPDQTLADPNGRIGAVATASRQSVSVLVYNFVPYDPTGGYGTGASTPYDHIVSLVVRGLAPGRWTWTRESVDGARTPATAAHLIVAPSGAATLTFTLEGEGVTAIHLARSQ
jgi:glycosyl hydrolase family 39 (putative alpha-L-iduronidase)